MLFNTILYTLSATLAVIHCLPVGDPSPDSQTSDGTDTTVKPLDSVTDFETIVVTGEEHMGSIGDLNPFDQQILVKKTLDYFKRHVTRVAQAAQRWTTGADKDDLERGISKVSAELDLCDALFVAEPDMKKFHDTISLLGVQVLELQTLLIDGLSKVLEAGNGVDVGGQGGTGADDEGLQKPQFYRRRLHVSDSLFDDRVHQLWRNLKDFTVFVEDIIDDFADV